MKKIITLLLLAMAFAAIATQAQLRKVPSEVTDALKQKYPSATNVSWKDQVSSWKASFSDKGTQTEAWFTGKGEWKESDKQLTYDALPAAVKDGFKKSKYSEWTPKSTVSIEKKGEALQYRVYVEKHSLVQKKYLYFDEKGTLLRDVQSI